MFHKFRLFLLKLLKGVPREDVPDVPRTKIIVDRPWKMLIEGEVVTTVSLDDSYRKKGKLFDAAKKQVLENISMQLEPHVRFVTKYDPKFGTYRLRGILAVDHFDKDWREE